MADKASRGLVIYGDGLASFINPSHAHLHSLASKGFCGFLTLPNAPPSGFTHSPISLTLTLFHFILPIFYHLEFHNLVLVWLWN